jgi:hypothetical protein
MTTPASIIARAQSYVGKLHDGPDVPRIAMEIAAKFPDMEPYCRSIGPDTSWCGVFNAFVHMLEGIRPAYTKNTTDYDDFAWADAPVEGHWGTIVTRAQAQPGDTIVLRVPHHITFYDHDGDDGETFYGTGGNQSNGVTTAPFKWANIRAIIRAPVAGDVPMITVHPLIKLGDTGAYVKELQGLLAIAVTGIFDAATDAAVRAYQSAHGLDVDGEVGDQTWGALLAKSSSVPQDSVARIAALAGASDLARYHWADRGVAPAGYIKGVAVTYARVYAKWKAGDSAARLIGGPLGDSETDALAWYQRSDQPNAGNLRQLFVLLFGLGMRESSGQYCEGRDTSASNTSADTAEAGLFQQSWNSHAASSEISKLFAAYSANPDGFLTIFQEGVTPKATDNYGTGDGAAFQALCKSCPAFAVEAAAVGLRAIRKHWGPINRREAEMRPEADALLQQVETIVNDIAVVDQTKTQPQFDPAAAAKAISDLQAQIAALTQVISTLKAAPATGGGFTKLLSGILGIAGGGSGITFWISLAAMVIQFLGSLSGIVPSPTGAGAATTTTATAGAAAGATQLAGIIGGAFAKFSEIAKSLKNLIPQKKA